MKKVFYADGLFFFHRLYEFSINCYRFDDEDCSTKSAERLAPTVGIPPTHTSCKSPFPKLPSAPIHQVVSGAEIYQATAT